jgi:uncharacterized protein YkwD
MTDAVAAETVRAACRPSRRPNRRTVRGLIAAVGLAVVMLLCIGCTPEQMAAIDAANADRGAAGLPTLTASPALIAKAQAWADQLAQRHGLSHSRLTDGAPEGWLKLGENVGMGPTIDAVEQGFMASPAHHANIVDPAFNWIGTGVATASDGTVFVVQVFGQY